MPTILQTKSIYFNDVNLIPTLGMVKSRKDIPIELYRIIVSPMLAIVGPTFVKEAAQLGLSICTPRFLSMEEKIELYTIFKQNRIGGAGFFDKDFNHKQKCFISIGLNEPQDELEKLSHNTNCRDILFDCANGYIPQIYECINRVWEELGVFDNLMVGNVITYKGVEYLYNELVQKCNSLFIRVGIGNGSPCASSDVAAINRGQITELMECYKEKKGIKKINLTSDGGIYKSGFVLKAFGAGADYCLMGGYFSNSVEAETNINGDGTYFGCASEKQNKLAGLSKHSEGKVIEIDKDKLKPLKYLVDELWGGISSGISYCGYKSVSEFIGNGVFEEKCNSLPPKSRY